ncbi:MAG: DHA1 family bicyclomycin/chloramphenicol resistance-like MFS transporter [Halocynthiibacter sp.]|jgi:DHA1 family bicyclomycin/chloramphenicol resistance-like MFS transporter
MRLFSPQNPLSKPEFIALMATHFAMVAFSVDSMLPALPTIAAELTPGLHNIEQLILTAFVLGLGLGTFVIGPISDAMGRKPTILFGFALYGIGALLAMIAPNFETLFAARLLQGLGAAAPRIVGLAVIRDLYAGRAMAKIVSFVMMIFILIPAVAPLLGSLIIPAFGWRGIFGAFIIFAALNAVWLTLRQPETLPPKDRRPLNLRLLMNGVVEVCTNKRVMICTFAAALGFGQLFATISSIQPIYDITFDRAASFPKWFALTALFSGSGTILNAALVMRLGMRRLVVWTFGALTLFTLAYLILLQTGLLSGTPAFAAFFIWTVFLLFSNGLLFGNLNALALEPMGHMAGLAASIIGGLSTVLAVMIAAPIGLAFNATSLPLALGVLICSLLGYLTVRTLIEEA